MEGNSDPDLASKTPADLEQVRTTGDLARVLRQLRRRHARQHNRPELTVRELARRSGFAYGVISEYLNGKRLPPTDRFDVLARLLGASGTELHALATARDRVEEFRRARRAGTPVPRELPPDVFGFTGRAEQLDELDRLLDRAGDAPGVALISAVAGTAGVGKTALAVRWAHRVRGRFPHGCLYVDLRGYDPDRPVPPADVLAGFLRSLGVHPADIPPDEAGRGARYRTLLAGRQVLVVLDNARDTEQVRPLLPGEPGCVTLITSRDALTGLAVRHGAFRIELDPLPDGDAVGLLGTLIGRRVAAEPDAAATLAGLCARLPLTLRLAAELAGTRADARLADLVAELTDTQHRLDRLDAGGEPRTATRAVFSWSYQNLPADAARAFRLIGLFPGHELDAYAMAALAGVDLDPARDLLVTLAQAHLIQGTGAGRYGVHDLLRAYAVGLATAEDPEDARRAALDRLLSHHLYTCSVAMDQVAPFDRQSRPTVPESSTPVPELGSPEAAIAWLDAERANLLGTAARAVENGRPAYAAQLDRILLRYLDNGSHYQEAEPLYRRALPAASPADKAHLLNRLGSMCEVSGRNQEAAHCRQQALQFARDVGDDVEEARALNGLAGVYVNLGRLPETLDFCQQALEFYRRTGDPVGQARMLGNIGCVYDVMGRYAAAVDHHRQALELARANGNHEGEAINHINLATVLVQLGHDDDALPHLWQALDLTKRTGVRESEAEALGQLGIVYRHQGRYAEAEDLHRQALDIVRAAGNRAAEGYALGHLGTVYERMGRHAEAVDHHRQALDIAEEIGNSNLTAEVLNRLGDTLRASDPAQAEALYRRALDLTAKTGNRYQLARAHHGIASTSADPDDARQHRQQALALYHELGVPEASEV
jgi:tetratricopeptide (TPR) repeat protein/transcriptional regulator with XRE-family HTH domain